MKRFFLVSGFVIVTALGLAAATDFETLPKGGMVSRASVGGLRVVSIGGDELAWLVVGGQETPGVLVVGIGGIGVVTYAMYGAGLLFATGQGAIGLFAIGQLAVGLVFVICQLGLGLSGLGQVLAGGLVEGQAALGASSSGEYLRRLNDDVSALLSWRAPEPDD